MFGAYQERGPTRYINTFKHLLQQKRIGKMEAIDGWFHINLNTVCLSFSDSLEHQLGMDGEMSTIMYYTDLKEGIMGATAR